MSRLAEALEANETAEAAWEIIDKHPEAPAWLRNLARDKLLSDYVALSEAAERMAARIPTRKKNAPERKI